MIRDWSGDRFARLRAVNEFEKKGGVMNQRQRWRVFLRAALPVALCLATRVGPASADGLIPREVFFGNPDRTEVQISPDGTRLSYLAPHLGVLNVWVEDLGGQSPTPLTRSTDRPVRSYFWAQNSQQIIYQMDRNGNEEFRLYAVDVTDGTETELTPYHGIQARFIASDPNLPDDILVGLNNRVPQQHDVWRINTRTAVGTRIFQNDRGFVHFLADGQLELRVATRLRSDGILIAYLRDSSAEDGWYELARWSSDDAAASGPLAIDRAGRAVYLSDARERNTSGLFRHVLARGGSDGTYELIAQDGRSDVSAVIFSPVTGEPQAVAFDYDRRQWTIVDDAVRPDWDYLTHLTDGEMDVVSRSAADQTWIVAFARDDGPREYYRYDRSRRRAEFLFSDRRELMGLPLARMTPCVIPARDGLSLVSYLTLPRDRPPVNLPTVLLVHGGPWTRDRWGYDPLHQWLANRGYAVLSVNFRGSAGFGKAFLNAGNHQWSGRMQDDLIDAVNWVVDRGISDPDRVAIMGGSYGGYATLVGLTFTPEFFAAGVDISGPADIATLLESIPAYWEPLRGPLRDAGGQLEEPVLPGEYLAALPNRADRPAAAHRAGCQRPAGHRNAQPADRRGDDPQGPASHLRAVSRRGAPLRPAREQPGVLRHRRGLPGPAPRGSGSTAGRGASRQYRGGAGGTGSHSRLERGGLRPLKHNAPQMRGVDAWIDGRVQRCARRRLAIWCWISAISRSSVSLEGMPDMRQTFGAWVHQPRRSFMTDTR